MYSYPSFSLFYPLLPTYNPSPKLTHPKVNEIQEDIEYYIESCKEPDFFFDDSLYESLDVGSVLAGTVASTLHEEVPIEEEVAATKKKPSRKEKKKEKVEKSSSVEEDALLKKQQERQRLIEEREEKQKRKREQAEKEKIQHLETQAAQAAVQQTNPQFPIAPTIAQKPVHHEPVVTSMESNIPGICIRYILTTSHYAFIL